MSSSVAAMNTLLSGIDWCAQLALPVRNGSNNGMGGPDWLMTVLPTAVALAALACVDGFPETPLCATPPGCALVGPAVTDVDAPCAKAPAFARSTWVSAICGP